MSAGAVWILLGLDEPTRDRAAIRKAYAKRLKETHPEDDPEGFQALRAAYEQALAWAGGRAGFISAPHRAIAGDHVRGERQGSTDEPRAWGPRKRAAEGEPGPRRREWRLADGPPSQMRRAPRLPRAFKPAAHDEGEAKAYHAAKQELARRLADPAAAAESRLAALGTFLASPALEQVARHDEAEAWLAQVIAINAPRSDALIDAAIAHFHWDANRVGPGPNHGARVLARRADLKYLADAGTPASVHRFALRSLMSPPNMWRRVRNRLTPGLPDQVRRLLTVFRQERPGLLRSLNPAAVAWWDGYLGRPRMGALTILALAILPALFAFLAWNGDREAGSDVNDPSTTFAVTFGVIGLVSLANIYGVQWPRRLLRERWGKEALPWPRVAWAPALLVVVLVAAIAPASAVTAAIGVLATPLVIWAVALAEPDRRDLGLDPPPTVTRNPIAAVLWPILTPGARIAWQGRTLFSFGYLAIFWLWAGREVGDLFPQMTAALVAAVIAFSVGAGTLINVWRRMESGRLAWAGLLALALLLLAAMAALLAARQFPEWLPLASALVATAVFAHKGPAAGLAPSADRARDLLMRYGWLVLVGCATGYAFPTLGLYAAPLVLAGAILAVRATRHGRREAARRISAALVRYGWIIAVPALASLDPPSGGPRLYVGGLWLLTGVAATVAGHIRIPGRTCAQQQAKA